MSEIDQSNPFLGLVGGRLRIYFEQAFVEYRGGKIRGAYDYAMMALNATLYELKPEGDGLFGKLEHLVRSGQLAKGVVDFGREHDFVTRHDRGISDMDLSYMSVEDLRELMAFLEMFYRSLAEHGVQLADDPRGQ